jgi:hypothetical protein
MVGSLDCMHVGWRLCPVALQGQFEGKEQKPTLILEAVADYDLWLWHSCFNHPGSLNDINVWDKSPLLREFLDGTFSEDVDFEFEINGTVFHQVGGENMCAFCLLHCFLLLSNFYFYLNAGLVPC